MKSKVNFLFLLGLGVMLFFTSCKKEEEKNYILESDYFTAQNSEYVKADFPDASSGAPAIQEVAGNPSVIPGGTNPLAVSTEGEADYVLVGVEGVDGYLKVPAATRATDEFVMIQLLISQNLSDEEFVIIIAVETDGHVSEHETIQVSRVEVGTGKLQVSLSWDTPTDVDLHLVEPNGAEIYYGNSESSNGGELDLDSNAGCGIDNVNNENITYSDQDIVEAGEYIVRVDYWSDCEVADDTHYGVTAYYDGVLIATTSGNNPMSGVFHQADADNGGYGSGVEVMRFTVPGTRSSAPVYVMKYSTDKPKVLSPEKM